MIEFDETLPFGGNAEMVKKITRPRALKILNLIAEAREVIIQTHPEPETLRTTYKSEWFSKLVDQQPEIMDPAGTIRFLQKLDAIFTELGLDDEPEVPDDLPPGDEDGPQGKSNIPPANPTNPNDPDNI